MSRITKEMQHGSWDAVLITVARIEGLHGQPGWRCRDCGLVIGGGPVRRPLDACPICAAASGEHAVVVVHAGQQPRVSTYVGDAMLPGLIATYRAAKDATANDEAEQAAVSTRGGYDTDGDAATPWSDGHRSEEQRAALALADAILARPSRS